MFTQQFGHHVLILIKQKRMRTASSTSCETGLAAAADATALARAVSGRDGNTMLLAVQNVAAQALKQTSSGPSLQLEEADPRPATSALY